MQKNETTILSIVIPVFNEAETIERVLKSVRTADLPSSWHREIIVVNDCSTDGTSLILNKVNGPYKIIHRKKNGGKGAALKDGFREAIGDYILIQDADLEYDTRDYMNLLRPIVENKADTVFGTRMTKQNNVPFSQVYFYGGLMVTKIFNLLFRSRFSDITTCYKVFPRSLVPELIQQPSDDFVFDAIELTYVLRHNAKRPIFEIPINYVARKKTQGKKLNWRDGWKCFRRMVVLSLGLLFKRMSSVLTKSVQWLGKRPVYASLAFFTILLAVFVFVYMPADRLVSSDDHLFHFRFAQGFIDNGFFSSFQNFKSIYLSKMALGNQYFVYYNFLFYLVIVPFTYITPLYLGIKIYGVFIAALVFSVFYLCLKKMDVKYSFIFTIALLGVTNVGFIARFLMGRPFALAPSLLILLLLFLYKRNYFGIFLVSFLYLFWHSATFFLPLCVSIGYFLIEKFYRQKPNYRSLLISVGGVALSILVTYIVSPGFLLYIKDIIFNAFIEGVRGQSAHIQEGRELYAVDFFNFVQGNILVFAGLISVLIIDIFTYVGQKSGILDLKLLPAVSRQILKTTALFFAALFFIGSVGVSGRFSDYSTLFAGLYVALSLDQLLPFITFSTQKILKTALVVSLSVCLIYLFAGNMLSLKDALSQGADPNELRATGEWLSQNTKPGSVVFDTNWDWFTGLYYYSPKDYYVQGLEPRFLYAYDPKVYWLLNNMEKGYVCADEACPTATSNLIHAFKSATSSDAWAKQQGDAFAKILGGGHISYVVTSSGYFVFNYVMDRNTHFKRMMYDKEHGYSIYEVTGS